MIVTHHYLPWPSGWQGRHIEPEVRAWSDEEMAVAVLAGNDPRDNSALTRRQHCYCPRIGRAYCKKCLGAGCYYKGKDKTT